MIKTPHYTLGSGDLIVSPPSITDRRFDRTVLMMTHTGSEGSMALCLNRRTDQRISKIIEPLGLVYNWDDNLYWGGPVSPTTVWMLHDSRWEFDATLNINDDWSMSSSEQMFHELASGNLPYYYRFFFGFSSWGVGQLEAELEGIPPWNQKHSWLIVNNPDPEWLIETDHDDLYDQSVHACSTQAVDQWL